MVSSRRPNILVTGTPGSGKTSLSRRIVERLGADDYSHVELSAYVRENGMTLEYDEHFDTYEIDEDRTLDALEPVQARGGMVMDHHSSDWFPERWFALVVVLHAATEVLWDRLSARGYSAHKVRENVQCEILNVVRDEAFESYPNAVILELQSDTEAQQNEAVDAIARAVEQITRHEYEEDGQEQEEEEKRSVC
ncbi:Adenylate kinase isoenzyme 6-like [Porphyridium purpureum]|uniref:Adenylate kinase isoenzyme 6 homolog n=1 Tax=Porphyridium purpureum TaxID=35688 RepID=A0A5J4YPW4_PORPP|nr:Adenylate kinase isoenzyme 6-like [Porphyridium purpureum]|eukprot:POR6819..scf222_8